ncbi:nucleoside permease [Algoriphagus boritolerans]|uniref:Nucleoside transporter n=1 Tax=Algoriphagus boritolerans DSM 17298 = JCM 18970 TaxID=1120964 RepID=A0A1H5YIN0_9BACT|nr:nucleoside permease [Algoriphagus boritolerans]SEG23983.1 nucleoside transporter [Algoriphagus boritolerans DSM 17298 = JCM 18970]
MNSPIKIRLSLMMFLEFFVWGSWYVTMGTFLGNNLQAKDQDISLAFSTQSFGAIIAPFIIGLIADRYFHAQRILGVIHLIGAGLMYLLYSATDFSGFFPFLLAYMILFMPTLALVNAISFNQMKDPAKEFSIVRVWGTIGWIAAGLLISFLAWDSQAGLSEGLLKNTWILAAFVSLVLGIYSFTLPATPPRAKSSESFKLSEVLGLEALALLKHRNFAIFFLSSILICIPLAFYYQNASPFLTELGVENSTGKMALGQVSEVLFLLALPLFFTRFGFKNTLIVAMLAWAVRYLFFAFGDADSGVWMLLVGILLHGVCYDFFFVSGQIYTDSHAGEKFKSSAQGLITLATYGIGMLIGFWAAGQISDYYLIETGLHTWKSIWLIPAGISVLVLLLFISFFKKEEKEKPHH